MRSLKPDERNPGKMTFTTASGLLPAGIAVYVQREPNGIGLETRYPIGLAAPTSLWDRGRSNSLRPAWEDGRRLNLKINRAPRRLLSASKPLEFSPFGFECSSNGLQLGCTQSRCKPDNFPRFSWLVGPILIVTFPSNRLRKSRSLSVVKRLK